MPSIRDRSGWMRRGREMGLAAGPIVGGASERLHQAALELFAAKGYAATGIRDLAEAAELSTPALYHYMDTKQDLLVRITVGSMQALLEAARTATADLELAEQRIGALVLVHVLSHAKYQLETLVADNELRSLDDANWKRTIELRDAYETYWADAIEMGHVQKVFRIEDPAVARLALLAMCTEVARWYSERGRLSRVQLAIKYANLALQLLDAQRDGNRLRHDSLALPDPDHYEALVRRVYSAPRVLR